VVTQLSLSGVV